MPAPLYAHLVLLPIWGLLMGRFLGTPGVVSSEEA